MTMISTPAGSIYSESTGQGAPYLWSHGLTHSIAAEKTTGPYDWSPLAERYQMVRYDALGHGRSEGSMNPDDYRWPRLADDIFRVADHYQLDQFIAGGASMGSASSIYAALKQPERIKGLVLVIPPTAWQTRQAQVAMYEKLAQMIEGDGPETFLRQHQIAPVTPSFITELNPEYKAARLHDLEQLNPSWLPAIFRGAGASDLPDSESFSGIHCPVLVLGWQSDIGHPVSTTERLLELLPQASGSIAATADEVRQWPTRIGDFIESIG